MDLLDLPGTFIPCATEDTPWAWILLFWEELTQPVQFFPMMASKEKVKRFNSRIGLNTAMSKSEEEMKMREKEMRERRDRMERKNRLERKEDWTEFNEMMSGE